MDTAILRFRILDLAIHGLLVPQISSNGTADELLEVLTKVHGRKILPLVDDVPFDLPENWCWIKLGDLFQHNTGKTLNSGKNVGTILRKYITTSNVYWDGVKLDNVKETLFTEKEIEKYTVRRNDLLVCEGGDVGRASIWNSDEEVSFQNHLHRLRPYTEVDIKFYFYMFYHFKLARITKGKGVGLEGLSASVLDRMTIPVPPLAEQHRIVSKIEDLLSAVDSIELAHSDISLAASILQTRIIDLAIHGVLVPQDSVEGTALELLDLISLDSGRKIIPVSNDVPYDLPEKWCWVELGDILDYEQPSAYIVSSTDYDNSYATPVLTAGKSFILGYTNEEDGIFSNLPCIIFDDFTTDSRFVDFSFKVKSSAMKILKPVSAKNIDLKFIAYFMSVTRLVGDTHKRYWISEYSKLPIPLPPLAEQHRIVAKVEELLSAIEKLK